MRLPCLLLELDDSCHYVERLSIVSRHLELLPCCELETSWTERLLERADAGGASAAALSNIAGNLGQSNTQALTNLASQGAQATAQGTQQAGQAFAAAEQARLSDLQNRLQMFQPYAVQKFGGTTGGNLAGVGGYQQAASQISAAEDPSALLKALGGQAAGSNFNWLTMLARDPNMANLIRTGSLTGQ